MIVITILARFESQFPQSDDKPIWPAQIFAGMIENHYTVRSGTLTQGNVA